MVRDSIIMNNSVIGKDSIVQSRLLQKMFRLAAMLNLGQAKKQRMYLNPKFIIQALLQSVNVPLSRTM